MALPPLWKVQARACAHAQEKACGSSAFAQVYDPVRKPRYDLTARRWQRLTRRQCR